MDKEKLLEKLQDIEWDDFEVKEAANRLPENVWDTVSAFSNAAGGWIVFGVGQKGKDFVVKGVENGEKIESDFLNTLRNGTKFNIEIHPKALKYDIDGMTVLAFHIPSSPFKPVYYGRPANTFIRSGSGDRRANEMEIAAMMRDQAFGTKSEEVVVGTSIADLNQSSLNSYRNHLRTFNPSQSFNAYDDLRFCNRLGISVNGTLTYGGLLMLGNADIVRQYVRNFWIDYIEIPGKSYADAPQRYTYRMPELDNIWECYQVIFQRIRIYADNPYSARPDGIAPDDESLLYALREGLVNLCSHADYFSPAHPTIRVFSDRIEFQNPGRFVVDPNDINQRMQSLPRNPTIIRLFRHAKLSENGGYGFDKMLVWREKTGKEVTFRSDLLLSTVTYFRQDTIGGGGINGGINGGISGETNDAEKGNGPRGATTLSPRQISIVKLVAADGNHTALTIAAALSLSLRTVQREIATLRKQGIIERVGANKNGIWKVSVAENLETTI